MSHIGFLFDLDGTLVNSKPAVERAWIQLAKEAQIPVEKMVGLHGIPGEQSLRMLMKDRDEAEIMNWVQRIEYLEMSDTDGITAINGAKELLTELNDKEIPWTIVTSCTIPLAQSRVKAAGIQLPHNAVTFDDVELGKPHPEPFILGAKRIGLNPNQCWVIEDAPAGVKSGKTAGCTVAAVLTSHDQTQLIEADHHLNHLDELLPLAFN
ncbi:MAG: HAD-IA family hydrolase [Actinobacteria bacterium]|nr:HAD-IA family hydrolase [Actinomycetota bacterium]